MQSLPSASQSILLGYLLGTLPFVELFDDLERLAESALLCAPAEEHVVRQAETESMTVEETRIDPIGIHPDMGG